jgi:hypothetical protein
MSTAVKEPQDMTQMVVQAEAAPPALREPKPDSLLNFIAMALEKPEIDVTKLQALLDMQRQVVADDARVQFNRALHAAQMKMPKVERNGAIDLGKGKPIPFATYEDVDAIVRPIEGEFGLSRAFNVKKADTGYVIVGTLRHVAGHSEETEFPLPNDAGPGRNALQAVGSTFSYGKRYITEAMYNIVRKGQDDDGKTGGTLLITADQVKQLRELLKETGTAEPPFLDYLAVEKLEDIEAKDFLKAVNGLLVKRQQQRAQKEPKP